MNVILTQLKSTSSRFLIVFFFLIAPVHIFSQFRNISIDTDENNSIRKFHFLTPSSGYVAFDKYVGYTQDSGHTFSKIVVTPDKVNFNGFSPDILLGFWINGVYAFNESSFLVYGYYGLGSAILLSNDKGSSFKLIYYYDQTFSFDKPGVSKIHFPQNGSIGFGVEFSSILKSNNGGLTWTRVNINPNAVYTSIAFFNSLHGYVINDGALQKSVDGGSTWTTVTVPGSTVNSMSFLDFQKGYIVSNSNLYYTQDAGQTWVLRNDKSVFPSPSQVEFIDQEKGYGFYGGFTTHYTKDSGKIWEPLPRDNNFSFLNYGHHEIYFKGTSQIWVGGNHGFLELSINGGGTPLPVSEFKIDLSKLNSLNRVELVNFSSLNADYKWYRNSVLISTAYNTGYQTQRQSIDTIKLIVTRNGYSDTAVQILDTRPNAKPCSAAFTVKLDTGTVVLKPTYHEVGVLHRWSFGDGTVDSLSTEPLHTYKSVGWYKIIHKVVNTIDNCTAIDSTTIQVVRTQNCLVPNFSFVADSFYNNILKFQLDYDKTKESGSGPVQLVTWMWGDSSQQVGNVIHHHEYQKNGSYRVSVSVKNSYTGCISTSAYQLVPVRMDTTCNASFDIRTTTDFYGFYYPDRKIRFLAKPLANQTGKRHIYKANDRIIGDGADEDIAFDFFEHGASGTYFNLSNNTCWGQTIHLNLDSVKRIIKHIVIDSVTGCVDSVSQVFTIPRARNVFMKATPHPDFPAYVTFSIFEKYSATDSVPYYTRWGIDGLYLGDYSGPGSFYTRSRMFDQPGVHKLEFAANKCTGNEREIYYAYYTSPPLPDCPIFPPDFSYAASSNPKLFEFINLSHAPNSVLNNSFVLYFGDGDSSRTVYSQHTYAANGVYQVRLVYKSLGGCTKEVTKTISVGVVTAVGNASRSNTGLRLYPNPAESFIQIDSISVYERFTDIEIYNTSGQKLISKKMREGMRSINVNIEQLAKGFYIVGLRRKNGTLVSLSLVKM